MKKSRVKTKLKLELQTSASVWSSSFSLSVVFILVLTFGGCQTTPPHHEAMLAPASVSTNDGLPVVHLRGTPYELGYQHGVLMRDQVREHYRNSFAYMQTLPKFRLFTRL